MNRIIITFIIFLCGLQLSTQAQKYNHQISLRAGYSHVIGDFSYKTYNAPRAGLNYRYFFKNWLGVAANFHLSQYDIWDYDRLRDASKIDNLRYQGKAWGHPTSVLLADLSPGKDFFKLPDGRTGETSIILGHTGELLNTNLSVGPSFQFGPDWFKLRLEPQIGVSYNRLDQEMEFTYSYLYFPAGSGYSSASFTDEKQIYRNEWLVFSSMEIELAFQLKRWNLAAFASLQHTNPMSIFTRFEFPRFLDIDDYRLIEESIRPYYREEYALTNVSYGISIGYALTKNNL
jgi:hypothetical protein